MSLKLSDTFALNLACLGPLGKIPKGAGTAGSALAAVVAPWLFLPFPVWARAAMVATVFLIGGLAAGRAEIILGQKDPNRINIDELMGQWLTFLPFASLGPWQLALGFLLFRVFDILKPWPIRQSEHWLHGGFGIMIDDAVAGIYGAALLGIALVVLPW